MVDNAVLIERAQAGEKEARKVLIEQNLGLVHHIVKRFTGRGIEAEDLFQIGTIGLMKSIDKFDTHFEVKFSTYAVPLIAGEIKRFPDPAWLYKAAPSPAQYSQFRSPHPGLPDPAHLPQFCHAGKPVA